MPARMDMDYRRSTNDGKYMKLLNRLPTKMWVENELEKLKYLLFLLFFFYAFLSRDDDNPRRVN